MNRLPLQPDNSPARVTVSTVYVEAVQVWFQCPCCGAALGGYVDDPRGLMDVNCEDCGSTFDIPRRAALIIT